MKDRLKSVFKWMSKHRVITIVGFCIIAFISLLVIADGYAKNKEATAKADQEESGREDEVLVTDFDKDQAKYKEKWGEPSVGFRWTEDGELQAIGEEGKTSEEIAYIYIRSLSTLDFANAQRYSYKTDVVKTYTGYYNSETEFSYNKGFESDMYKNVLLSMEPLNIVSVASFADFKEVITMEVEMLDLTDKDFWKEERFELYDELKKYRIEERDTTKMKEFIYTYVLKYYTSKSPKTRTVTLDLVLEETIDGSWLVTNDSDLDGLAKYQDGEIVVSDILMNFDEWVSTIELDSYVENPEGESFNSNADSLLDKDDGVFRDGKGSEPSDGTGRNGDELE